MGGKIGVLVGMEVSDNLKGNAIITELGHDVCMQIAAMHPQYLNRESVPADVIAHEKEILMAQTVNEGKPANVAEKIVNGRINKFYEENCLLDQAFVKENKLSVAKHVEAKAKELGGSIQIVKFARYEKGEGLAKREDDFAAEVAAMAKKWKNRNCQFFEIDSRATPGQIALESFPFVECPHRSESGGGIMLFCFTEWEPIHSSDNRYPSCGR